MVSVLELFDLTGRVVVITGGAGLLGAQHADAVAGAGGTPVLVDVRADAAERVADRIRVRYGVDAAALRADISDESDVSALRESVLSRFGRVDGLVNNAANNPQVGAEGQLDTARLEDFPIDRWRRDIDVGLTGALLCSRAFGVEMARRGSGVIVNIASDLAVIAPDQRLYQREGVAVEEQAVKPVSYVVVKTALLGLTRYLATYWAGAGVRVNALSPGGVYVDQQEEFVRRFSELVPLGRMAEPGEYRGALAFLLSDASSYMTGQNLIADGGRSAW